MKRLDEMDQTLATAQTPRSMLSKFVDMTLLLLACGGLGYCVGKLIAGGDFSVIEGIIILAATAIIFGLIQRRMRDFPAANRKREVRRHLRQLGVGAFIGMVGMGAVLLLLGNRLERLADQMLYWNLAGAFLAVIYILFAAIIFMLAANKKMMNVKPGDEPLSDDEYADTRIMLFWAAIGLLTYGLILGIGVFSSSYEGAPNWLALAALIATLVGQSACNFILWRRYDELYREVTRTACAVSYVIVEAIIILWAGLAMFGFQVRFDPMAVLVVVMSISLITTLTVSVRRGLS